MLTQQSKIFCVGMNKTGTTSIGDALQILGYRRYGWCSHSAEFTLRWHEGVITDKIKDAILAHDAFEDFPWPLLFKDLDHLCPSAKFILTTRSSTDVWLRSIQQHIVRRPPWVGHYLIYGSYDPVRDASLYRDRYEQHNRDVRAYFQNRPGKLLEVCFERESGWPELCAFLEQPVPDAGFPHANKAP